MHRRAGEASQDVQSFLAVQRGVQTANAVAQREKHAPRAKKVAESL